MVFEEKQPIEGLHINLPVRKRDERKHTDTTTAPPPEARRVDVTLQKPFDHDIGDLYDPDHPPEND
ncbi:hypothetical protein [Jeongeupia sp. USM3]|uniref:hypothetical protein n=1 Tax=Jeongeupia sp. USM3 TaxID=1906741 RepID=UPI00089E001C|nr:hypothetical protein [Jeongeupia sp. USM3]AOX99249.1 hypothetical protein BJP62_01535 [Jeongeupia sp. USM3]